jgi:saccharopine dehydrogenase-like NADP-dependent oxidoreductase
MKVAVLGAGLQGIATCLDLAWNEHMGEVLIADYELARAERVAALCNAKYGPKVRPAFVDVTDHAALVELIRGYDQVINVVNYYHNIKVMRACLEAGIDYMDLGGLYVESVKQLALNDEFERAGLLAITGIGGCAGVTNISAAWAVERLDTVEEIHFYCGCDDWSTSTKPFEVSYAIETIMDEFRMNPIQFVDGDFRELAPHAGEKWVTYSQPVGPQLSHYITHSELGTVPFSFRDRGLKQCTYSIGFPKTLADRLQFLHELGFSGKAPITVDGVAVSPVRVLKKLMDDMPDDPDAVINDCDVIQTVVIGHKDGQRVEYMLESVCRPVKWWPELMGAQVYIGGASAWTAELKRRGLITRTGVCGPELAVPPEPFFEEAAKREIYVTVTQKFLVGSNDWDAVARKTQVDQWA